MLRIALFVFMLFAAAGVRAEDNLRFVLNADTIASWEEKEQGFNITLTPEAAKTLDELTRSRAGEILELYVGEALVAQLVMDDPLVDGREIYLAVGPEEWEEMRELFEGQKAEAVTRD